MVVDFMIGPAECFACTPPDSSNKDYWVLIHIRLLARQQWLPCKRRPKRESGALLLGKPLTSSGGCAVKHMTASMSKLYCACSNGDGGKGLVPSTRSASCDALIGFWPVGEDMLTLPLLQLELQPANCPPAGLLRGVPLRLLDCANGGKHLPFQPSQQDQACAAVRLIVCTMLRRCCYNKHRPTSSEGVSKVLTVGFGGACRGSDEDSSNGVLILLELPPR